MSEATTELPFVPTVIARVTRPQLKLVLDVPVFVKIVGDIYQGKPIAAKEGEPTKEPPHLVNIIDLTTGTEAEMIVNAVLKSVLEDDLEGSYKDRCFQITKQRKQPGKSYNQIDVLEIADPSAEPAKKGAAKK